MKILGVDSDGHCHFVFEMRPHARQVNGATADRLGEAITRIVRGVPT